MEYLKKSLFWVLVLSISFFQLSSAWALVLGVVMAFTLGNPYSAVTKKLTPLFLQISIVGLGFGMNLQEVAKAGLTGFTLTILSISATLLIGLLLGHIFKVDTKTSWLISIGTAICGGSAIAAIAPIIKAKEENISIALGTVFLLNALALIIFPPVGHVLNLTQTQFGTWSALAIHDTSSVVGATLQYGTQALQVGTTIKLARALWIIPLSFLVGHYFNFKDKQESKFKIKIPWFILGFLLSSLIASFLPQIKPLTTKIELASRMALILTLFFIGTGLSPKTLKTVGFKSIFQGVGLWLIVLSSSLFLLKYFA